MSDSLLIVEDESLLAAELSRRYRRHGWEVQVARTLTEARRYLNDEGVDPLVVLSDMSLPDGNALDLLERLPSGSRSGEWVFLTGYGSISDSVRGLRLGAYDFLEKPCDLERLDLVIAGAARSARAQRRLKDQELEQNRRYRPEAFVGRSAAARTVREMLARLDRVPFSAVLLAGETGTGKGLAARILHYGGARQDGPMVEVNCAALPRELLESELFGHESGAFTGAKGRRRGLLEQAHGGTLFLDEISEMDLDLQSKLLRAVEDKSIRRVGGEREIEVDVQFVASSNRNLRAEADAGRFRPDLYHRLSVFTLDIPSLRVRIEDVEDLVPMFVAEFNAKAGKTVRVFPDALWTRLREHAWPGNVRELRNVVERCVLFSEDDVFPLRWLNLSAGEEERPPEPRPGVVSFAIDGSVTLEEMDREIIRAALVRSGHNATAAARLLGTTRETMRYRIQKYSLSSQDEPEPDRE